MIVKKLLDVCDFQGGTQPPKEEWINEPREGYVRMLQIRDYSQGDSKFIQYVKDTKKLHKCKKDDIMLSRYGYIGQAFMGLEGAYNVALVKVIKKQEIHTQYLLYYFQSYYFQHFLLSNVGARATIPGFNKDELKNALIVLPDIDEQKEIASKIVKIDELIEYHEQQLAKLDELVKSRFVEMFGDIVSNPYGWPKQKLSQNATLLNGRAYKQEELLDSGKYPVLRVGNFFSNRGWYYSDLELDPDKYCENGDLLYAWSASFGPQIWTGDKVIYHYHIWKVVVGEAYDKVFLCKLFDYATSVLMGDTHGIAMMHLTKSGMENTEFILPPISLQQQFATFVEQVDKSKFEIQQSLEKLETLKKALMQKYFN